MMVENRKEARLARKRRKTEALLELSADKPLLRGRDYLDLKRRLRERKKILSKLPQIRLLPGAAGAILKEGLDLIDDSPLALADIRDLASYALSGEGGPFAWCKVLQRPRIAQTVLHLTDGGLGAADYLASIARGDKYAAKFGGLFDFVLRLKPREAHLVRETAFIPLTPSSRKRMRRKAPARGGSPCTKVDLLLDAARSEEERFPLPRDPKYASYVYTADRYEPVTADSPVLALDCEMCLTSIGALELTRVCVVDEKLDTVYASFVKPRNGIVDYLTRYSGITEDLLKGVTATLEDVQRDLRDRLPPDAILAGHSLNCDLDALKMMHPYVIDTSVIYNVSGDPRRKSKLSFLAKAFLGKSIQNKGLSGHDPLEDAQTAMELVKLKLAEGLAFGDVARRPPPEEKRVYVPVYDFVGEEARVNVVGTKSFTDKYGTGNFVTATDDSDALAESLKLAPESRLLVCHSSEFWNSEDNAKTVKRAYKRSAALLDRLAENGLFIAVWGGSEAKEAFAGVTLKKKPLIADSKSG